MQTLQFEASWNKALSLSDREMIEELFQNTKNQETDIIRFTPIWEAVNYKDELLITVLVHNFTESNLEFHHTKLQYIQEEKLYAEHVFTVPQLTVPPNTSIPWTFIFPRESRKELSNPKNGKLNFA